MPQHKKFIGGAKLFNMPIVGDFNKIPVQRITDGVVAALDNDDMKDAAMDDRLGLPTNKEALHQFNFLKRFSRAASDRGTVIIKDEKILPGDVLHVDVEDEITTAYQFIELNRQFWLKVWEQVGDLTEVTTYPGIRPERKYVESLEVLEGDVSNFTGTPERIEGEVLIVENGNGILIPATETILRIQELTKLMEKTAHRNALQWFIKNWVGNIFKLQSSVQGNFLPIGEADPISAANPALSDMVFKEMALILPFYFQATSSYTLQPRESGIARYLNMQGYLNRVKLTQRLARFVMKELFGVDLTFTNLLLELTLEKAEGNSGGSIGSIAEDETES